jgi:hypothetical protein
MSDTPRITRHAAERCLQMGVSTKVAKRIAQRPSLVLPDFSGRPERRFMVSEAEPDYAVVVDVEDNAVVTVMYRDHAQYRRREEA